MMSDLRPRLLDVKNAAKYLSVGLTLINSKIRTGEIPALRINKRVLLDVQDLDKFIDKLKIEQGLKKTG